MKIFNVFNPPKDVVECRNEGVSMTVPDQSMTIQEILQRYARGLPLGGQRVPMYEDDDIGAMPDIHTMDLADRQEYFESVREDVEKIKRNYARAQSKTSAPTPVPTQPSGELP